MNVIREDLQNQRRGKQFEDAIALLREAFPEKTVQIRAPISGCFTGNDILLFSETPITLKRSFFEWLFNKEHPLAHPCVCNVSVHDDEIFVDYDYTYGTPELGVKVAELISKHFGGRKTRVRRMGHLGLSLLEDGEQRYVHGA